MSDTSLVAMLQRKDHLPEEMARYAFAERSRQEQDVKQLAAIDQLEHNVGDAFDLTVRFDVLSTRAILNHLEHVRMVELLQHRSLVDLNGNFVFTKGIFQDLDRYLLAAIGIRC